LAEKFGSSRGLDTVDLNSDHNADAAARKEDDALAKGKQSVVAAAPHAHPGLKRRTALTDDDMADSNPLAAELLDPAVLRATVSTVPSAALSLFMSHLRKLQSAMPRLRGLPRPSNAEY